MSGYYFFLKAIRNICDSWQRLKISTLPGVWKLIPILMDDFEWFKTSRGGEGKLTASVYKHDVWKEEKQKWSLEMGLNH